MTVGLVGVGRGGNNSLEGRDGYDYAKWSLHTDISADVTVQFDNARSEYVFYSGSSEVGHAEFVSANDDTELLVSIDNLPGYGQVVDTLEDVEGLHFAWDTTGSGDYSWTDFEVDYETRRLLSSPKTSPSQVRVVMMQ